MYNNNYIDTFIQKGKEFFDEKKYHEAEKLFLSAINDNEHQKHAYYYLGLIAHQRNEWQEAKKFFLLCLDCDPYDPNVIEHYYKTIDHSKNYYEMLPILQTYLKRFPFDSQFQALYHQILSDFKPKEYIPLIHLRDVDETKRQHIQNIKMVMDKYNNNDIHKPHRNLLLMEIPGSGIEVFSDILNSLENMVVLQKEVDEVDLLPEIFLNYRNTILDIFSNSIPPTNQIKDLEQYIHVKPLINKSFDEDVMITVKSNLLYLIYQNARNGQGQHELKTILNNYGYQMIAIIRHPVDTIMSWNLPEFSYLPEFIINPLNNSSMHQTMILNRIEKQAQLWENFARILININNMFGSEPFWKLKIEPIKLIQYENLEINFDHIVHDICDYLSLVYPSQPHLKRMNKMNSHNITSRIIVDIKNAVMKYCPSRFDLGYDSSCDESIHNLSDIKRTELSIGVIDYQDCLKRHQL